MLSETIRDTTNACICPADPRQIPAGYGHDMRGTRGRARPVYLVRSYLTNPRKWVILEFVSGLRPYSSGLCEVRSGP